MLKLSQERCIYKVNIYNISYMKNYILILFFTIIFCSCIAAETNIRSTQLQQANYDIPIPDNRVLRFCYILNNLQQICFRSQIICSETEFEDRYVNHSSIRFSCRTMRVERSLLRE